MANKGRPVALTDGEIRGYLEVTRKGRAGTEQRRLTSSHMTIGRDPKADVVLDHTTVSRSHAELFYDPFGRWWIHDLNSTNGTLVNGAAVEERLVSPSDAIVLGDFTLRLRLPGSRDSVDSLGKPGDLPEISDDEDATLIAVLPKSIEAPQINATNLTNLMALSRKLMTVDEKSQRLEALCAFIVGSDFPADSAVPIRMRGGKAVKIIAQPFLRDPSTPNPARQVSVGVLRSVWKSREPVLGSNSDQVIGGGIRRLSMPRSIRQLAVVACPLQASAESLDVLYVEFPPKYGTPEWLTLVALLVETFQQAEQVWEMRRHVRDAAFIESELEMARQIQEGLVPASFHIERMDVAIGFEPCRWVGGDYVDTVPMPDGRVLLAVADVCGKGMQASLVASSLHTMVRSMIDVGGTLPQLVQSLNRYLCRYLPDHSFVTMALIAVDPETGKADVLNAGHPPPFVVSRSGKLRELQSAENVAFGMVEIEMHMEHDVLEPGDVLMLYTDGLTELVDEGGTFLGEQRLSASFRSIVMAHPAEKVEQFRDRMFAMLDKYRGSKLASDDRTFLIARRGRGSKAPRPVKQHRRR